MERPAIPTRVLRVDSRYRHRAQIVPLNKGAEAQPRAQEEEAGRRRGRDTMAKDHRFFHRRAAQAAVQVVTVNVDIVATVDTNGNLVAQETIVPETPSQPTVVAAAAAAVSVPPIPSVVADAVSPVASVLQVPSVPQIIAPVPSTPAQSSSPPVAPVPQVPSVPSVPTPSVPSVPSVPPFPTDLVVPTVPAYPFSSNVVVAQTATSASPVAPSAVSTSVAGSNTPSASIFAINPVFNSTLINTASSFSASSIVSSGSLSVTLSPSASQPPGSSSRRPSEISTGTTTSLSSLASNAAATTYYGSGGGGGAVAGDPPPAATNAASDDANDASSPAPLETPQVVGSVVGSLAGAALILAIILLLIRRHKRRRGGALQLTGDDHTDRDQPMREAPPRSSTAPLAFLHRFSGMSRSTAETNLSGGERSFQRVSGRKLPSAFSEGMTSEQFSRGGTMSGSSFYQDDHGFYGGPGLTKEFGKEIGDTPTTRESGQMNFRPSPARTPVIRHPDDIPPFDIDRTHLSPPQSPNPDFPARGTLGRSLPSADGSRSSRFTENV